MGPVEQDLQLHAAGRRIIPLEVALSYDKDKGIGILKWKANPVGQKPVKYRVYGSDEKGFSVSDVPYKVTIGEKYKTERS